MPDVLSPVLKHKVASIIGGFACGVGSAKAAVAESETKSNDKNFIAFIPFLFPPRVWSIW